MREIIFLKKNQKKWELFETIINGGDAIDPDDLAQLYIQITDDLSYAQTYYPNSDAVSYLNQLSMRAHQNIYKNQKIERGAFKQFWRTNLPLILFEYRRQLLYALLIFVVAVAIGVMSSGGDQFYVRTILGDDYVNMTIENIKNNDPMAVYKQDGQLGMSLHITFNNIKVAFFAFVFGIFTSFGSAFILVNNGIMLGSFTYFFYKYGLLLETSRVIWIHGALEISAIIIAGAAGMIIGNSLIFKGNLPWSVSVQKGARDGMKIICGLIPVFITAGFLEGFVTRYTEMPIALSWTIISSSFLFVFWYFGYYPRQIYRKHIHKNNIKIGQ